MRGAGRRDVRSGAYACGVIRSFLEGGFKGLSVGVADGLDDA